MSSENGISFHKNITLAGSLIAIGIVFGDIGTSPLYTINAVFHGRMITESVALGSLSCIFWTLFLQTTLKYVIITLQADNKGEGGIFSLYALVRRYFGKNVQYIAMAGGSFLIADGIITPPISVASAVEGVRAIVPDLNTVPIIIAILIGLFLFQQFGTDKIGKIFGPIMVIWFGFIGVIGLLSLSANWGVIKAINPYYAYQMLVHEPGGFWLLGSVFLCTTGAEALYSDMGHCGRNNIRISWAFIKVTLVLSYAGQTAWLLNNIGSEVGRLSPFFHIIPKEIYWVALVIATLATIIASQALISGCFTLINEAIRLNIWPKHKVSFPSNIRGQLYIPAINWFLMISCIAMVLYFRESTKMEAAFGLSVTLTMLMSTVLLVFYLIIKRAHISFIILITALFLSVETGFLLANLQKIKDGGWVTLLIGAFLFAVMIIWSYGSELKSGLVKFVELKDYIPLLKKLSEDNAVQKYATNLVYLTSSADDHKVEKSVMNSILNSGLPKRANIYWFVHVKILDDPYFKSYKASTIVRNDVYYVTFNLGFREQPRVGYYFKQVVNEMIANNEVNVTSHYEKEYQEMKMGDFKFVTMTSFLSYDNHMPYWKNFVMKLYYNLRIFSIKESTNYELDRSNLVEENYPLVVKAYSGTKLVRET